MAGTDSFARTSSFGWAAAAVLGIGAFVCVWREIQGLAQGFEHILGILALTALTLLLLHLRQARSRRLADAQAADLLQGLLRELGPSRSGRLAVPPRPNGADRAPVGQTDQVLKALDEISLLANMTAVNAALEASRAPESLAGVTVVADEIRDLARRGAAVSRELADLLDRQQSETVRSETAAAHIAETLDQVKALLTG